MQNNLLGSCAQRPRPPLLPIEPQHPILDVLEICHCVATHLDMADRWSLALVSWWMCYTTLPVLYQTIRLLGYSQPQKYPDMAVYGWRVRKLVLESTSRAYLAHIVPLSDIGQPGLPNLQELYVSSNHLTAAHLEEILPSLPNCIEVLSFVCPIDITKHNCYAQHPTFLCLLHLHHLCQLLSQVRWSTLHVHDVKKLLCHCPNLTSLELRFVNWSDDSLPVNHHLQELILFCSHPTEE